MPKVKLKAPTGSDEANHSVSFGKPYKVNPNDGTVEVDSEAVGPLLDKGGFTLADPPAPVALPAGMIQVVNPSDSSADSISFGGKEYKADANGVLAVPVTAVHALRAHGFMPQAEAGAKSDQDNSVSADELVAVIGATVDAAVHEAMAEAMQPDPAPAAPADAPKPAEAPKPAPAPAPEAPKAAPAPEAPKPAAEPAKPAEAAPAAASPAPEKKA